jgi:hypothetical protein
MATVTIASRSGGVLNTASGSFTSDNAAQVINLGFKPAWMKVINETDTITWEVLVASSSTKVVKTTSSATSIDTGSAIVINSDGTVTLSATAVGNSKVITFVAFA